MFDVALPVDLVFLPLLLWLERDDDDEADDSSRYSNRSSLKRKSRSIR